MIIYDTSTRARFWSKVSILGSSDCWVWTASANRKGYGKFRLNNPRRTATASRVAYEMHTGKYVGKAFVCHSCDNPPCCNPSHLWLGDSMSNSMDSCAKNRNKVPLSKGQDNGNAVLTEDDVAKIRICFSLGENNCEISRKFGVTHQNVWRIRHGKNWK
jgi:hypothetical protein